MEGELSGSSPLGHIERIATYLSEAGLFELLCKSEMPAARPFQDWLFEEVLPTIRRTGSYSLSLPQLVSQVVAQALPAIQQAILDCHSHHIFEASHGGSSDQDQAMLREVGRDSALERDTFLAEGPLELGAFLREQLPAADHWKVARIKVSFAREAKARASRGTRRRARGPGWSTRRARCASPTRRPTTSTCCCSSGSPRRRSAWRG